jgi:hypothetical protein
MSGDWICPYLCLRRRDKQTRPRDASWHPSFANHYAHEKDYYAHEKDCLPEKGGGAPIRRTSHDPRPTLRMSPFACVARQRLDREPLAFRRSAAALARANASAVGSAPVPAFPETRPDGRYPLRSVLSLPSSSETGRRAGRAVAQSRPGAVCETARGHRTRSASRSHPECAPRQAEFPSRHQQQTLINQALLTFRPGAVRPFRCRILSQNSAIFSRCRPW